MMVPESIAADPILLKGAIGILSYIDDLPSDAAGVLRFGDVGAVLVESSPVCWATAVGMEQRFAELLRHQRNPPLDRGFLEQVIQRCRASGSSLGDALLGSGEITEPGLRAAIFRQSVESIAHIARQSSAPPEFIPRPGSSFAARFRFSTVEILAALGARRDHALAALARQHLSRVVMPETAVAAFLRDEHSRAPDVIAAVDAGLSRIDTLCEAGAWALDLFDLVSAADPSTFLAAGTWRGRGRTACVVTWRVAPITFVALTSSRAAAAVLVGRIAERRRAEGTT